MATRLANLTRSAQFGSWGKKGAACAISSHATAKAPNASSVQIGQSRIDSRPKLNRSSCDIGVSQSHHAQRQTLLTMTVLRVVFLHAERERFGHPFITKA